MKAPAHTRKSTDSWWAAEERNNTTRSNAVMKIHFRLLVTIGNLVSLIAAFHSPDKCGGQGSPPSRTKDLPVFGC